MGERLDRGRDERGSPASNQHRAQAGQPGDGHISEVGRLAAVLRPLCQAAGLDLEEIEVAAAGRRRLVRVVVDRDGGVDLDAVAEISRAISAEMDSSDAMGAVPYVLEVTSPGVDRPLVRPAHWRRATGRLVRVELAGGRTVEGRVVRSDDAGVDLRSDDADACVRVSYGEVAGARVQVEFSRVGASEEFRSEGESDGEEGR
ncbi:MAG TPA: ribosome maturation factor RimP [Sporichthyaceae bacterium]|jgi:ribosome maturation factor RimP|nr:ribosome maturation factor RimP [Sporichthyaceae bacterium]